MSKSSEKIKKLEIELANFKQTFNTIGSYIYTKDTKGKYTFANKMVCDLFQHSLDEIIGHTDEDFFDIEKSKELIFCDLKVLQEGLKIEQVETNHIKSTNETRNYWSVKSPLYDQEGNITGLCGISTDITEKLKTEKELQRTKQVLEHVLNNDLISVFVKDKELKYCFVNENFAKILNSTTSDIIGKRNSDFFPEKTAKKLTQRDIDVLSEKKKIQVEETIINKSGNSGYFLTIKTPLIIDQKIEGLIGISYDVSNLSFLKKQLKKQNHELKYLLDQRRLFIEMVVHELRIPISFIKILSEILEKGVSEDYKDRLELIKDSSSGMIKLVDSLLDISQIETGSFMIRKKEIDYIELVEKNHQKNLIVAEKKNIEIEKKFKISKQLISVDRSKIEQVLDNLLSNAIKFSHSNSKITIEIYSEKNTIVTKIIDQGQGIKDEEIDIIFDYFKKTSTIPTNNELSYGLGLGITKKIVESHNGTIAIESKIGKGTIFTFTLPIDQAE